MRCGRMGIEQVGVVISSGIAGVTLVSSYLLTGRSRKEKAEAAKATEDAAATVRMEALRRGEAMDPAARVGPKW